MLRLSYFHSILFKFILISFLFLLFIISCITAKSKEKQNTLLNNLRDFQITVPKKTIVAVIDIQDKTNKQLSTEAKNSLTSLITRTFIKNQLYSVVERKRMQPILAEMALSQTGLIDDESKIKIGRMLNAQYICASSIENTGSEYLISIDLINVEYGIIEKNFSFRIKKIDTGDYYIEKRFTNEITGKVIQLENTNRFSKLLKTYGIRYTYNQPELRNEKFTRLSLDVEILPIQLSPTHNHNISIELTKKFISLIVFDGFKSRPLDSVIANMNILLEDARLLKADVRAYYEKIKNNQLIGNDRYVFLSIDDVYLIENYYKNGDYSALYNYYKSYKDNQYSPLFLSVDSNNEDEFKQFQLILRGENQITFSKTDADDSITFNIIIEILHRSIEIYNEDLLQSGL